MNNRRRFPLDSGLVQVRAAMAKEMVVSCRLCPHQCGVNRFDNRKGKCGIGNTVLVASVMPHHGEERCLSGMSGSGTIFFSGCNLDCIFCQNSDLSHDREGIKLSAHELAEAMLYLQEIDCHNLNLVTPTHVVPQILESMVLAVDRGFHLPIVYNSGGYESIETLRLLEGIVDIYMPDFKYWDEETAERLSSARDYPEIARLTVREMYRQVGDLVIDDSGLAIRGLLVRHLVLPDGLAGTESIVNFLAQEISPNTYVNIMGQYRPHFRAYEHASLKRAVTYEEICLARQFAREAGLHRFAH